MKIIEKKVASRCIQVVSLCYRTKAQIQMKTTITEALIGLVVTASIIGTAFLLVTNFLIK